MFGPMEATQPAPGAAVEPVPPVTPEADEAEDQDQAGEPEAGTDTSTAEPDLQLARAEFTRSQQAFAEAKALLGLDKKASRTDVINAIQALQQGPAGDDGDDGEEVDPRLAEARARAEQADERAFLSELRVQQAIYGDTFTQSAIDVVNIVRTTNDPGEIVQAFAAFVEAHGGKMAAATESATDVNDEAPDQPLDVGTSEGDRGPSAQQPATSAKRGESGAVDAVRGIFRGLGIGSEQQPPRQ